MKALQVVEVKPFMAKLLIQDLFDPFLLSELTMNTFTRFQINGKLHVDFFSAEELEQMNHRSYAKWIEIKPFVYSIVKGSKTPLSFHITLMLSKEQIASVVKNTGTSIRAEEVSGMYLHIKYENSKLHIITGIGLTTFTMDKSLENEWDWKMEEFLKKHEIAVVEE